MEFQILTAFQNFNVLKSLLCPTPEYSEVTTVDYIDRYPNQNILFSDLNTAGTLYFSNMPSSAVLLHYLPIIF